MPPSFVVRLSSSVLSHIPCEVTIGITRTAPELAAGIAPLARNDLPQFTSALWASRHIFGLSPCLCRPVFDSGAAQALREATLLQELAGRAVHLPLEKRRRATDRNQDGIRSGQGIFTLQPFAAALAHGKDVHAVFVVRIADCRERIEMEASLSCKFVQRRPGHIKFVNQCLSFGKIGSS